MNKVIYTLVMTLFFIIPRYANTQDLTNIASQKPIAINGYLETRALLYNARGISNRMDPFNYLISGSPVLSIYGWAIPITFTFSKRESNFQQPFNQFGISPTYKWITLHGGYRNVTFSPYTLAGHTMLGGGFEIRPGKLRAGLMYGRLNRAAVIDTTSMALVPFSFTRKGLAAKLGFGTDKSYFDLNFLHAQDDSVSKPNGIITDVRKITPAGNSVLGYGTRIQILKNFFIESDGAISLYTRDLNSPLKLDSIPDETLRKLGHTLNINGSSEWFLAFSAAAGYSTKNYGVKINYKRIEPEFKSMGAYFFNNDVENITIAPNYSHPSGRFNINGSFGVEQDNVRLQKESTSKRVIGSANLSSNITDKLGLNITFNNYSNNQKPNTLVFADSLKIVQTTKTLGFMPRYTISSPEKVQVIFLSANFNSMNDYNSYFESNSASRDISTQQYLLNYTLSLVKKGLTLNGNLSYTNLNSEVIKNNYKGTTVGANYIFLKNKASSGVSVSYLLGNSNDNISKILNGSFNFGYSINKSQSIRALVYFTNNNPGTAIIQTNPAFSETRGEIAYQLNFGL